MSAPTKRLYEFGPFIMDTVKRVLLREGEIVPLAPKAFETLLALVEHHGQVLEKEKLMEMVWPNSFVEEGNLTYNISLLRKALGESASERRYVVTIPGRGYRFVADIEEFEDKSQHLIVEKYTKSTVSVHDQESPSDEAGRSPYRAQQTD